MLQRKKIHNLHLCEGKFKPSGFHEVKNYNSEEIIKPPHLLLTTCNALYNQLLCKYHFSFPLSPTPKLLVLEFPSPFTFPARSNTLYSYVILYLNDVLNTVITVVTVILLIIHFPSGCQ